MTQFLEKELVKRVWATHGEQEEYGVENLVNDIAQGDEDIEETLWDITSQTENEIEELLEHILQRKDEEELLHQIFRTYVREYEYAHNDLDTPALIREVIRINQEWEKWSSVLEEHGYDLDNPIDEVWWN